jgi:hypothetical protein
LHGRTEHGPTNIPESQFLTVSRIRCGRDPGWHFDRLGPFEPDGARLEVRRDVGNMSKRLQILYLYSQIPRFIGGGLLVFLDLTGLCGASGKTQAEDGYDGCDLFHFD